MPVLNAHNANLILHYKIKLVWTNAIIYINLNYLKKLTHKFVVQLFKALKIFNLKFSKYQTLLLKINSIIKDIIFKIVINLHWNKLDIKINLFSNNK